MDRVPVSSSNRYSEGAAISPHRDSRPLQALVKTGSPGFRLPRWSDHLFPQPPSRCLPSRVASTFSFSECARLDEVMHRDISPQLFEHRKLFWRRCRLRDGRSALDGLASLGGGGMMR
jgi:hypothetical protein